MDEMYSFLFEAVADLIKLIFFATIVIIMIQYTSLHIAIYKTKSTAEQQGKWIYKEFVDNLSSVNIKVSDINVETVSPDWDVTVERLGNPMKLVVKKPYTITVFGTPITVNMKIESNAINQGYFGEGYGDY